MRSLLLLSVVGLAGCYTLRPAGAAISEGSRVAFDLNDEGRAAMADRIGPEILQMEGRLISSENGEYVLAVKSVRFLRGGDQVWAGERVRVSGSHVGTAYERRFSAGRTAAMAAVTVGGVAAFIITRSLLGGGREPGDGRPDPDPNQLTWPPAGIKP